MTSSEWHLGIQVVQEIDETHHLGIHHSVGLSSSGHWNTAGRSAFFALNTVGSVSTTSASIGFTSLSTLPSGTEKFDSGKIAHISAQ